MRTSTFRSSVFYANLQLNGLAVEAYERELRMHTQTNVADSAPDQIPSVRSPSNDGAADLDCH